MICHSARSLRHARHGKGVWFCLALVAALLVSPSARADAANPNATSPHTSIVSSCAIEESYGVDFTAASASSPNNLWVAAEGSEPVASMIGRWNGRSWRWWCDNQLSHIGFWALAAVSRSEVWTVGPGYPAGVYRWNGATWNTFSNSILSIVKPDVISATASDDVWVAGDGIAEWNGATWKLALANPSESAGSFGSISAGGPDNVWAVWYSNSQPIHTGLYHWDGRRWTVYPWGSGPLKDLGEISSLAAASSSSVWAAGNGFAHWNGKTWQVTPSQPVNGAPLNVMSMDASVRGGAWALGAQTNGTEVEHWNGKEWVRAGSPVTFFYGQPAIAVDKSGSGIWTVGMYAVKQWTGKKWKSILPRLPGVYQGGFDAVTHVSQTQYWMAGSYSSSVNHAPQGLIERWDGMHGVVTPIASPSKPAEFLSISGTSPDDVWAAGQQGMPYGPAARAMIQHWNGRKWQIVPNPEAGQSGSAVSSITAISPRDAWAVAATNLYDSVFEHWNGRSWKIVPGADVVHPSMGQMAAIAPNNIWAVGATNPSLGLSAPLIEHWNGRKWSAVPADPGELPAGGELYTVTAFDANDVWASGCIDLGTDVNTLMEHWNGKQWSLAPGNNGLGDGCYNELSMVSKRDIWGVGSVVNPYPTVIQRWNGKIWEYVPSPFISGSSNLIAISGTSSNDAWVVGETGPPETPESPASLRPIPIEHWNGRYWKLALGPAPK